MSNYKVEELVATTAATAPITTSPLTWTQLPFPRDGRSTFNWFLAQTGRGVEYVIKRSTNGTTGLHEFLVLRGKIGAPASRRRIAREVLSLTEAHAVAERDHV